MYDKPYFLGQFEIKDSLREILFPESSCKIKDLYFDSLKELENTTLLNMEVITNKYLPEDHMICMSNNGDMDLFVLEEEKLLHTHIPGTLLTDMRIKEIL
jgi:hypothetical protein